VRPSSFKRSILFRVASRTLPAQQLLARHLTMQLAVERAGEDVCARPRAPSPLRLWPGERGRVVQRHIQLLPFAFATHNIGNAASGGYNHRCVGSRRRRRRQRARRGVARVPPPFVACRLLVAGERLVDTVARAAEASLDPSYLWLSCGPASIQHPTAGSRHDPSYLWVSSGPASSEQPAKGPPSGPFKTSEQAADRERGQPRARGIESTPRTRWSACRRSA
jgi:hypothetical protein